jgi:hypothetical protein
MTDLRQDRKQIEKLFGEIMLDHEGDVARLKGSAGQFQFRVDEVVKVAIGGEEFYFVYVSRTSQPESEERFRWYTGEVLKYKWLPLKGPAKGSIRWM